MVIESPICVGSCPVGVYVIVKDPAPPLSTVFPCAPKVRSLTFPTFKSSGDSYFLVSIFRPLIEHVFYLLFKVFHSQNIKNSLIHKRQPDWLHQTSASSLYSLALIRADILHPGRPGRSGFPCSNNDSNRVPTGNCAQDRDSVNVPPSQPSLVQLPLMVVG
jgi:hypothetical protein